MARYYRSSYNHYLQYLSLPIHFFFFLLVVFLFLVFTWYINYENKYEDILQELKLVLLIFPVILLLVVHWLSRGEYSESGPSVISSPEEDSPHGVGGSPVGVALLLILLLFMVSHHTSFQERWFPLFSRR